MALVTIETNGLIHVEEGTPNGKVIAAAIQDAVNGHHAIRLPAISASELQKGGKYLLAIGTFLERVQAIGLTEDALLLPLGYYGVTFWDQCVWTSEEAEKLESAIHDVLFPPGLFQCPPGLGDEFKNDSLHSDYRKWRNAKCDVLGMWCHITYGGDMFVTADENFHSVAKKAALVALGAKAIVRPSELRGFLAAAV